MTTDAFHERLLTIVHSLPEAVEDWPWGSIHCKVAGKIFVGWGRGEDGIMSLGFRTSPELQSVLVGTDPRFTIAKYVGKYGGVDMRIGTKPDWREVEQFIVESYRIIAPKRLVRALGASKPSGTPPAAAASPAPREANAPPPKKRAAAKKSPAAPSKKRSATPAKKPAPRGRSK